MGLLARALHAYRRHVSIVRGAMAWLVALLAQCARAAAACAHPRERQKTAAHDDAVDAACGERILPGAPPSRDPRWTAVELAPPPELAGGAAEAFHFRGACFAPPLGRPLRLALTADTTAATLLDFCAAWLRVPAESLSIAGGALVMSVGMPRRTVAEAGLGAADVAKHRVSGPPVRRVFALPWCAICLSAASGAVWSCRGGAAAVVPHDNAAAPRSVRHTFCDACARRYAATVISARSAAALRCPAPACPHTLLSSAELASLVDVRALAQLRAARTVEHAARLRAVIAGAEGAELAAMLARGEACACPACAVIIQKGGGCRHMHCSVCGEDFEWD